MPFAENTTVPQERSRAEIERLISKYGADSFCSGWQGNEAMITFRLNNKFVVFRLKMPDRKDEKFTHYRHGSGKVVERKPEQAYKEWEQAGRQRWRALALVIKAKLEAVESGITTFETEFLAHIVLPGGQTVGQMILPKIEEAYATGNVPPLLPWEGEKK